MCASGFSRFFGDTLSVVFFLYGMLFSNLYCLFRQNRFVKNREVKEKGKKKENGKGVKNLLPDPLPPPSAATVPSSSPASPGPKVLLGLLFDVFIVKS